MRPRIRRLLDRLTLRPRAGAAWLAAKRAELATAAAFLGGWALVTWAVASLTVWQVWPLSGGVFLLSLGGWRLLWRMACDGLYALTHEKES